MSIENKDQEQTTMVDEADDYIAKLNELKNNTVSKEEYEKLKTQTEKYKSALFEGTTIKREVEKEQTFNEALEGYNTIIKKGGSNLDWYKQQLKVRELYMKDNDGLDPWMNSTLRKSDPTYAERWASEVNKIIEQSDGDSAVFSTRLKSAMENWARRN